MGGNTSKRPIGGAMKYPELSGGDVALNTLALMNMYRPGLIPALISSVGGSIVANKQARAQNDFYNQQEGLRRVSQAALLRQQGNIPDQFIQALSVGDDSVIKAALEAGYNTIGVENTNSLLERIGIPALQGVPNREYQNAILNTMYNYDAKQPLMRYNTLRGDVLEATKEGEIKAKNAKNQAEATYAVPMTKAKYQGQQLTNTGKEISNQYAPAKHQLKIKKDRKAVEDSSPLEATGFSKILQENDIKFSDPTDFRIKSYKDLLRTNAPPAVKAKVKQNIDDMAIMKNEIMKLGSPQGTPQKKKQSNLGIQW